MFKIKIGTLLIARPKVEKAIEVQIPYTTNYVDNLYYEHPYRYTLYGIQH